MDTIPNYWEWKNPVEAKKDVRVFRPYYGPSQTRGFGNSSAIHEWELGADDSDFDDFTEMKEFWNSHYPGIPVILFDPVLIEARVYEINSDFSALYNPGGNSFSWKFRIREAYPYETVEIPPLYGMGMFGSAEYTE